MFAPFKFAPWPLIAVIFFFSVVIHEVAHGVVASKCGDDTAKLMGRITLNPIAHIDLFGTILVPILMYSMGGFIIGWAKPVPVNPLNFKNFRGDTMKVGASGPLTNFALAVIFTFLLWIINFLNMASDRIGFSVCAVLASGVTINLILGLFNLTPIPPLDGSRIISSLLPMQLSQKYDSIAPFGFFILIFVLGFIWPVILGLANTMYKVLFWGIPV
ncbi:site-2 protease family protein [Elusimicrobiota bacterium]